MGIWDFIKGPNKGPKESKEKKETMTGADINKIVCPYCFETFAHHEVHFRVNANSIQANPMSDDDIIDRYGDDEEVMQEELDKAKIARRFVRQVRDEKLSRFWEGRFGISPNQRDDKEWNNPVITPEDNDMLFKQNPREGRVFSNQAGAQPFLYMVKDYYGNPSVVRLCPHCHNKLSSTYGEYPVVFISVVGITGSGKTVYLNQLIENLQTRLSGAGLAVTEPFNMRQVDRIKKNKYLPMSTQEGIMYPPMMINIAPVKQGVAQQRTLVFYDIAGENCVDQQRILQFGPYLAKSQAIILLIDPKQFITFNDSASDNPANTVVNALVGFFGQQNKKPLMAATLSKSDTLKKMSNNFMMSDIIREDSVIFKKIDWSPKAVGFYHNSYNQMMGEMTRLRKHIDPHGELDKPLQLYFREKAYFSVSALGVDVQPQYNVGTKEMPRYINLEEESVSAIETLLGSEEDEPPYYDGEPKVLIGYDSKVGKEIFRYFDEIRKLQERPRFLMTSDPDPCRIEEPLLWILFRLGIIEAVDA